MFLFNDLFQQEGKDKQNFCLKGRREKGATWMQRDEMNLYFLLAKNTRLMVLAFQTWATQKYFAGSSTLQSEDRE